MPSSNSDNLSRVAVMQEHFKRDPQSKTRSTWRSNARRTTRWPHAMLFLASHSPKKSKFRACGYFARETTTWAVQNEQLDQPRADEQYSYPLCTRWHSVAGRLSGTSLQDLASSCVVQLWKCRAWVYNAVHKDFHMTTHKLGVAVGHKFSKLLLPVDGGEWNLHGTCLGTHCSRSKDSWSLCKQSTLVLCFVMWPSHLRLRDSELHSKITTTPTLAYN
eukprot:6468791-Amphidinium_carterae.1